MKSSTDNRERRTGRLAQRLGYVVKKSRVQGDCCTIIVACGRPPGHPAGASSLVIAEIATYGVWLARNAGPRD
jgi:hypothetical protein